MSSFSEKRKQSNYNDDDDDRFKSAKLEDDSDGDEDEDGEQSYNHDGNDDQNGELLDRRKLLDRYISRTKIQNEYDLINDDNEEEADNQETENVLNEVNNAQETATLRQYDGIKITPFNLEEEQEEGEYDKSGNFIFKKKKQKGGNGDEEDEEEDDNWADSINWSEVEKQEQAQKERQRLAEEPGPSSSTCTSSFKKPSNPMKHKPDTPKRSKLDCYKQMLRIVGPEETVQKAIRRLGNSIPKRQFSQKKKTPGQENDPKASCDNTGVIESKGKLDLIIELAHQLLEEGDTDIYQKNYEQLEEAINLI